MEKVMDELLRSVFSSQWLTLCIVSGLLLFLAELGFRIGIRRRDGYEAIKEQVNAFHGAVLGLLALLLGFTFAMVVQRYDLRRDLVVQEANAIGTTFLRAAFLPEPHRTEVEDLLRRYVQLRLDFYRAGPDRAKRAQAEADTAVIQKRLWRHAVEVGAQSPTPLMASFVATLNETIDLDASRLAALRNQVPAPVWLLLLFIAASVSWTGGYATAASGKRNYFIQAFQPLLLAMVITVLVDLATPRRGLIGVSQQSLIDLQQSIATGVSLSKPPSLKP
jgi:hypothetical protein